MVDGAWQLIWAGQKEEMPTLIRSSQMETSS
jgi:hypothetical protein